MTETDVFVGPHHAAIAGKTGKGVCVATIDSGVVSGHPHVGLVSAGISIGDEGQEDGDFTDRLGHGTAVAAAIREKAPDADLLAVRVFTRELTTNVNAIVQGIDWATASGATLINLSLGTTNPDHVTPLTAAVQRSLKRGVVIVSAYERGGVPHLPGSLPNVLPVVLEPSCNRNGLIVLRRDGLDMLGASGLPRPIPGVSPERNVQGISFAVANVTGIVACCLEGNGGPWSPGRILAVLKRSS